MPTQSLTLYERYSREDVHNILEPGKRFTPQAGTWGLLGIVPIPDQPGDFVFFVTFGKEQAGHKFDEWVSESGVINWQSQPSQTLADRHIQQFLHHDPVKNNIHLFLRTEKTGLYTYLGRLAYHRHDPQRERPVYIQWKILDWNIPQQTLVKMGLKLRGSLTDSTFSPASSDGFEGRVEKNPVQYKQLPRQSRWNKETIKPRTLTLYDTYSRQEVHDIFEPGTLFTQTGLWGQREVIPPRGKQGDFIFFITPGKKQSFHTFEESINEAGILNWRSLPSQRLKDLQIQQFLHHDPTKNNIHLFLRTDQTDLFTYMGLLAYHSHDPEQEHPVWVQWQILDWNISQATLKRMGLKLCTLETAPSPIHSTSGWFEWRDVKYEVQLEQLWDSIRRFLRTTLPYEATRFRDWYVEFEGHHLSAKWIFHLITKAGYHEFDAPTARDKLAKIGIQSYPIHQAAEEAQATPTEVEEKQTLPEIKMYRNKYYKPQTINAIIDLILNLAQLGEIQLKDIWYGLKEYHLLQLIQSGWAIPTPYALVATPRFLDVLPLPDREALMDLLQLTKWNTAGWANFDLKALQLPTLHRFPELGFEYMYNPKPNVLTQDSLWRPVWLVNYLPEEDWDDWEVSHLKQTDQSRREAKLYVHSALPIQNIYGGIPEAQDASWKTPFYWLMLQLLILSDPGTGNVYDTKIFVDLSDGWRDGSIARLFLDGEYVGDLTDCLETLFSEFHWVWVNRSGAASQDHQAVLGLLRLLLKIDIAELGKDGRVQFTDAYRSQLFQSQAKAKLYYHSSKEARDQLRDAIKEMSK